LLTYTHSMAGEIFANLDLEMLDMIRKAMADDPQLSRNAEQVARALYFGSAPLASRSETTAQMEQEVGSFARAYLAGTRILAKAN
jgi:hypothetical protein